MSEYRGRCRCGFLMPNTSHFPCASGDTFAAVYAVKPDQPEVERLRAELDSLGKGYVRVMTERDNARAELAEATYQHGQMQGEVHDLRAEVEREKARADAAEDRVRDVTPMADAFIWRKACNEAKAERDALAAKLASRDAECAECAALRTELDAIQKIVDEDYHKAGRLYATLIAIGLHCKPPTHAGAAFLARHQRALAALRGCVDALDAEGTSGYSDQAAEARAVLAEEGK